MLKSEKVLNQKQYFLEYVLNQGIYSKLNVEPNISISRIYLVNSQREEPCENKNGLRAYVIYEDGVWRVFLEWIRVFNRPML